MSSTLCSIAIVDDDVAFAETLATFSRMTGCDAQVVDPCGTFDIVGRIVRMSPDLALIDVGLGQFDGAEVAAELKARGSAARLIAVTGDWRPDTTVRCLDSGFEAVWLKPIDPARVEGFLDELVAKRSADR